MVKVSINMAEINAIKSSGYVVKVLSGSMNGIEFSLGSHAYFICVGDAAEGQENLAKNWEYAERTLYLPTTKPGHNFVLDLADQVTEEGFEVTVNNPDQPETLHFAFNVICHVEGVYFALKREGEAWSQDVLKGELPVPAKQIEAEKIPSSKIVTRSVGSSNWKYPVVIAAGLSLLVGLSGTVAWSKYHHDASSSQSTVHLMQQIVGNNVGYSAQQGRDNQYYLFAQNSQQAEWARRSAARSDATAAWKIQTPEEEEARLARVLDRNNIAFFTIRFNDLTAPTVIMSSTRNATDQAGLESVKKQLLDAMPYAKKVNVELKSDQEILSMAEEGLVGLGFEYQMTHSDRGVTLLSSISSSDDRMAEYNQFVSKFYRLWGRHYVHFSVALHDDAYKDKSFKYGDGSYVKMSKSHWVFNS